MARKSCSGYFEEQRKVEMVFGQLLVRGKLQDRMTKIPKARARGQYLVAHISWRRARTQHVSRVCSSFALSAGTFIHLSIFFATAAVAASR